MLVLDKCQLIRCPVEGIRIAARLSGNGEYLPASVQPRIDPT